MGNNNIVLLFSILIIYVVFGLLYTNATNDMVKYGGGTCEITNTDYTPSAFGSETKSLFSVIVTGADCVPSWVNWIFSILTALVITTSIILLIHG